MSLGLLGHQDQSFQGPVLAGVHGIFPRQADVPQKDLFDGQPGGGLGLGRKILEVRRQVPFPLEELHRQLPALFLVLGQLHLFLGGPAVLLGLFQGQL